MMGKQATITFNNSQGTKETLGLYIDPFTIHVTGKFAVHSAQCTGSESSIPLTCVLTREFLVKKKCLLVESWTVKIAPVLESRFSGFLQDLIRLKKKIDDICGCKLLNGQTGTML